MGKMLMPSREPYNPADDLKAAGVFLCTCSDIIADVPSKKYAGKFDIVIQFTVSDMGAGQHNGKKTAIVCGQSIYRPKKGGKDSLLLQYMIQAGVKEPWNGCDPFELLNRRFHVRTELHNGKAYVRGLMPVTTTSKAEDVPTIETPDRELDFDPSKMDD